MSGKSMQTISFRPSTPSMRSLPIGKADFIVVFNSSGTTRPNGWIHPCLTTSRRCATSSNTTAPHGPSMRHVDGIVRRMARDPSCQNRKTTHHHSTPKASTKCNRWWAAPPCTVVEQLIQQFYRRSTASQRNNPKLPSALDKMPRSF